MTPLTSTPEPTPCIGVFDSGIGGLTVLEALLTIDAFHNDTQQPGADGTPDFAQERFIYFGDQANMPYGNYSAVNRTDYLRELIVKDAIFLLGRRFWTAEGKEPQFTKPPVKAIVIACNTATAYGLEDIRKAVAAWKIPVIVVGVVEAGARGVLESNTEGGIGVGAGSASSSGSVSAVATSGSNVQGLASTMASSPAPCASISALAPSQLPKATTRFSVGTWARNASKAAAMSG